MAKEPKKYYRAVVRIEEVDFETEDSEETEEDSNIVDVDGYTIGSFYSLATAELFCESLTYSPPYFDDTPDEDDEDDEDEE